MFTFENLLLNEDYEGLRLWHLENTPWCTEDTISQYISQYKAALEGASNT